MMTQHTPPPDDLEKDASDAELGDIDVSLSALDDTDLKSPPALSQSELSAPSAAEAYAAGIPMQLDTPALRPEQPQASVGQPTTPSTREAPRQAAPAFVEEASKTTSVAKEPIGEDEKTPPAAPSQQTASFVAPHVEPSEVSKIRPSKRALWAALGAVALVLVGASIGLWLRGKTSAFDSQAQAQQRAQQVRNDAPLTLMDAPPLNVTAPSVAHRGPQAIDTTRAFMAPQGPTWPKPKLSAIDAQTVDTADGQSLAAFVASAGDAPTPLALWAQFRLAWAMGDAACRARLNTRLERGRVRFEPWEVASLAGIAALRPLDTTGRRALLALHGPLGHTPQGRLVLALAQAQRGAQGAKRALATLYGGGATKLSEDQQILRFSLALDVGAPHAVKDAEAYMHHADADSFARMLEVLKEHGLNHEAHALVSSRLGGMSAKDLQAFVVQASDTHRHTVMDLAMRSEVVHGQLARALDVLGLILSEPSLAADALPKALANQLGLAKALGIPAESLRAEHLGRLTGLGDPSATKSYEALLQNSHDTLMTLQSLAEQKDWPSLAKKSEHVLWQQSLASGPDLLLLLHLRAQLSGPNVTPARVDAQKTLQMLCQQQPHNDAPWLLQADVAEAQGNSNQAANALLALMQRHTNNPRLTQRYALALIQSGHHQDALEALHALAKVLPEARDAAYLYLEGMAFGSQDVVRARGALLASAQAHPRAEPYILLAHLEEGRGQGDAALEALNLGLVAAPHDATLLRDKARLLLNSSALMQAQSALETLLKEHPDDDLGWVLMGDCLHEQSLPSKAAYAYQKAVLGPHCTAALLVKVARLELQELGHTQAALGYLGRALKKDRQNSEAHYFLGLALRDLGRRHESAKAFVQSLQQSPDGPFANQAKEALSDLGAHPTL